MVQSSYPNDSKRHAVYEQLSDCRTAGTGGINQPRQTEMVQGKNLRTAGTTKETRQDERRGRFYERLHGRGLIETRSAQGGRRTGRWRHHALLGAARQILPSSGGGSVAEKRAGIDCAGISTAAR